MNPAENAEPSYYTIMVRYTDSDGRPMRESFVAQYLPGESYYIVSPVIPGYQANIRIVSGSVTQNATYEVTYTQKQQNLLVTYQYLDGSQAAAEVTQQVKAGDHYAISVPEIEGYTAILQTTEGIMPGYDMKVSVVYVANDTQAIVPGASSGIEGVAFTMNNAGECFE